jgi:hypothetical protein
MTSSTSSTASPRTRRGPLAAPLRRGPTLRTRTTASTATSFSVSLRTRPRAAVPPPRRCLANGQRGLCCRVARNWRSWRRGAPIVRRGAEQMGGAAARVPRISAGRQWPGTFCVFAPWSKGRAASAACGRAPQAVRGSRSGAPERQNGVHNRFAGTRLHPCPARSGAPAAGARAETEGRGRRRELGIFEDSSLFLSLRGQSREQTF